MRVGTRDFGGATEDFSLRGGRTVSFRFHKAAQLKLKVERFGGSGVEGSLYAVLRGELAQKNIRETYRGQQDDQYRWVAQIIDRVNPVESGARQYLNLYRVRFQVFHDSDQPRLELVTLIPDR